MPLAMGPKDELPRGDLGPSGLRWVKPLDTGVSGAIIFAESREPRAESREPRAESREPLGG